jgi:hypothetical protein
MNAQRLLIAYLLLCIPLRSFAQTDSSSGPSTTRLIIVGTGSAAIVVGADHQNYNSWWKGERSKFHWPGYEGYALGADKFGHAYFSFVTSDLMNRSFLWAGIRDGSAQLYGGALSLLFETYVEIEDGFTPAQGFSIGDEAADLLGASLPYLRRH